jgi:ABC-type nickel/cobalt efflux system permease component RcnA
VLVLSRAATVLVLVIGPIPMTARSFGNQRKDVGRFIDGVAESNAESGSRVDYEHEHEHRCAEHESQHVSRNESQNEKTPEQGRLLERSN